MSAAEDTMTNGLPMAMPVVYPIQAFADAAVGHQPQLKRLGDLTEDRMAVMTKVVAGNVTTDESGRTSGRQCSRCGALITVCFPDSPCCHRVRESLAGVRRRYATRPWNVWVATWIAPNRYWSHTDLVPCPLRSARAQGCRYGVH